MRKSWRILLVLWCERQKEKSCRRKRQRLTVSAKLYFERRREREREQLTDPRRDLGDNFEERINRKSRSGLLSLSLSFCISLLIMVYSVLWREREREREKQEKKKKEASFFHPSWRKTCCVCCCVSLSRQGLMLCKMSVFYNCRNRRERQQDSHDRQQRFGGRMKKRMRKVCHEI